MAIPYTTLYQERPEKLKIVLYLLIITLKNIHKNLGKIAINSSNIFQNDFQFFFIKMQLQ